MKDYKIRVDFVNGKLTQRDIELMQNDYNTTTLYFEFVQDVTDYTVTIAFLKPNGESIVDNITLDSATTGHHDLNTLITQEGTYQFGIAIFTGTGRLTNTVYGKMKVKSELIDFEEIASDDDRVPILTNLINQVTLLNANITDAEEERTTSEEERILNEELRQTAEADRITSEDNRISAEQGRESEEDNRISAEQGRENNENIRVNTETVRTSNETTRINNEISRQSNEQNRSSAERERISQEINRVTAEQGRYIAEQNRESAENARNVYEEYDSITSYVINNKVIYEGSSYICIQNCNNILPTNINYWRLIASKGDTGNLHYATFDIQIETGNLIMYKPDTMSSDVDFEINANGYLIEKLEVS